MIDYNVLYFTNLEKNFKNNILINNNTAALWTMPKIEVTLLPPILSNENDTEYDHSKKVN